VLLDGRIEAALRVAFLGDAFGDRLARLAGGCQDVVGGRGGQFAVQLRGIQFAL
jgi:hypothetical protein